MWVVEHSFLRQHLWSLNPTRPFGPSSSSPSSEMSTTEFEHAFYIGNYISGISYGSCSFALRSMKLTRYPSYRIGTRDLWRDSRSYLQEEQSKFTQQQEVLRHLQHCNDHAVHYQHCLQRCLGRRNVDRAS